MAELTVSTPKKHHLQDRCVLCGMVFCNVEITPSGRKIKTSVNMNKKLKITKQTVDDLHLVIDMDLTSTDATGICIKCNRLVKGVVEKLQIIKQTLNESIGYSRKLTVKRLLWSPSSSSTTQQPMKKVFSPKVQLWPKTKLKSASELQTMIISPYGKSGNVLQEPSGNTCTQLSTGDNAVRQMATTTEALLQFHRPILPAISEQPNIPNVITETSDKQTKARKSLFSPVSGQATDKKGPKVESFQDFKVHPVSQKEITIGGDRLTDEKIQVAQQAMRNADSGLERLEGFISKIEDFHRLMNFLEAIHRLSYNTQSSRDRGTVHYYRNLLNARNVKGEVKNSYRAYKQLYYTLFDAICCVLFLKKFELDSCDSTIPVPQGIKDWEADQQLQWLNDKCGEIVKEIFPHDLFAELQNVLADPDHEENYWVNSIENDNFKCHFCNSRYKYVTSLKMHEKTKHQVNMSAKVQTTNSLLRQTDELNDYLVSVFRLTALHQNLNSAVDMGDGYRVVRSAKFETPIYNRTNKVKYLIGSVHLTALVSGTLPAHQSKRLIANRFINISGGKNNNLSLDEFVEILNRDTKNATHGFQTKDSIVQHSKEFPHLVHAVKHFDAMCEVKKRKGFHKLPSYKEDVKKVLIDLLSINGLEVRPGRTLHCRKIVQKSSNPFSDCFVGLPVMIARHKPELPFRRLRNKNM